MLKIERDGDQLKVRASDGKLVQGVLINEKVISNGLKSKLIAPFVFQQALDQIYRKLMDHPGVTEKEAKKTVNDLKTMIMP